MQERHMATAENICKSVSCKYLHNVFQVPAIVIIAKFYNGVIITAVTQIT
jgi:uncharacterized integral membrane protein